MTRKHLFPLSQFFYNCQLDSSCIRQVQCSECLGFIGFLERCSQTNPRHATSLLDDTHEFLNISDVIDMEVSAYLRNKRQFKVLKMTSAVIDRPRNENLFETSLEFETQVCDRSTKRTSDNMLCAWLF